MVDAADELDDDERRNAGNDDVLDGAASLSSLLLLPLLLFFAATCAALLFGLALLLLLVADDFVAFGSFEAFGGFVVLGDFGDCGFSSGFIASALSDCDDARLGDFLQQQTTTRCVQRERERVSFADKSIACQAPALAQRVRSPLRTYEEVLSARPAVGELDCSACAICM